MITTLDFDTHLAKNYQSKSQIARVLTENWLKNNGYCPNCAQSPLVDFANNQPVADFYCQSCLEQFELKSKQAKFSTIINDGAYATMIERIQSESNPSFFFLTYDSWQVTNFLIIPKHFFSSEMIVKRKPLAATARRAGWVGCNIDLRQVPESGKVFLVKNQQIITKNTVTQQFRQSLFLRKQSKSARGWTLDVWQCLDRLSENFNLNEVYQFANVLQSKHPNNRHIKDKVRQQLQILRDKGVIEFLGRGKYRKRY